MANSPLLNQVNFGINSSFPCNSQEDARNLIDMIWQLGNARSLVISQQVIEVLSKHEGVLDDELSPFVNLESLTVKLKGRNESLTISLPLMKMLCRRKREGSVKQLTR